MGYPDMMRDIVEQTRREETINRKKALENLTIIDRRTGLYNRRYFDLRLDEEMSRSRLYGNDLSLILIDVGLSLQEDHGIKNHINHKTMKVIADIVSDCLRDRIDLAFQYDKGKFAVILPEADNQEASLTADNIQKRILKEKIQGVNPYAGIAQYRDHEHINELIQAADEALHENIKKVSSGSAYF